MTSYNLPGIVNVLAYRRPDYLLACLNSLLACQEQDQWIITISIDGPTGSSPEEVQQVLECEGVAIDFRNRRSKNVNFSRTRIFTQTSNLGVANHPKAALSNAVQMCSVCCPMNAPVLAIEEDCLLSPDALRLCSWFASHPETDDYLFLNLAHLELKEAEYGVNNPGFVRLSDGIESPWSWCFKTKDWLRISEYWNCKRQLPTGWDWSLSFIMAMRNWWALTPSLPRSYNIGRERGTHGSAEHYDKVLAPMLYNTLNLTGLQFNLSMYMKGSRGLGTRSKAWMVKELEEVNLNECAWRQP